MYLIIGAVIVIGSVLGGFVMVGGQIMALWHLNEVIVICGAALGAWISARTTWTCSSSSTSCW
jgi:chemotaxis protein MotA